MQRPTTKCYTEPISLKPPKLLFQYKKLLRVLLGFVTVLIFSQLTAGCFSFRMNKSQINNFFEKHRIDGKIVRYAIDNRTINYIESGADTLPHLIFVHGSPGSLSAFIHFFVDSALQRSVKMISVDRPGFGHSNFGNGEISLESQARYLKPVLESNTSGKPNILVGHSLGGPVIARIAMDYPDLVDGLIMVAPSIAPDLEPHEWFRFPLSTPFFRWLLPRSFRASNDEIYFLKPELEKMLPLWKDITSPVTVIQGGEDNLVHPGNAEFAQKKIENARVETVFVENMDHFVPWNRPDLIKQAIHRHLNQEFMVDNAMHTAY